MKTTSYIGAAVSLIVVMLGGYGMSVARQPADLLVVQATSASIAPARLIAEWMVGRLDHCPSEDFLPTTPVSFVVAGWEQTGEGERFERLLGLLITRGCEIDSYSGRGLTPLHNAILFNNVSVVDALLRLGADRNLVTAIQSGDDDREITLDAISFARYLDSVSGEDRSAIIQALD